MNLIILKGRIARDIEIKFSQANNTKIASFTIAVQRDFKNKNREYEADFFNCIAFTHNADFIEKYFSKGQEILINGNLQNRSWETESGEKKYATDIIVNKAEFCGSKNNSREEVNINNDKLDISTIDVKSDDDLPF